MKVDLSKQDVVNLIKGVHIPYGKLKPVLLSMGEWKYDMNGPTGFNWRESVFEKLDTDELYNLYKDLSSGKLFKDGKVNA